MAPVGYAHPAASLGVLDARLHSGDIVRHRGEGWRTAYNVRMPDDNPRLLSEVHTRLRCLVPFHTGGDEGRQLALHVPLAVAVDHEYLHVTVAGEVQHLL